MRTWLLSLAAFCLLGGAAMPALAQVPDGGAEKKEAKKDPVKEADDKASDAQVRGDTAWMLTATAFVMLMVPGLALFYAGMVRRKNVLATMMQSMIALSVIGVFWVAVGYSLAFGKSINGVIGWSPELVFMQGVRDTSLTLPNTNIPVYVHMLFQGMFAIITPALISGAIAERIRFGPYVIFLLLWSALVYCPLAHMVWAMDWWDGMWANGTFVASADAGKNAVGFLGKAIEKGGVGAIDFAGGTVVHIAAGFSALGAILVLRKRVGYPELTIHPNSMVLCLTGAGLLWFGWFGFNGGSGLASGSLAGSAFAATQAAAAAAGLSWVLAEWVLKGKPTALGLASGIVAGLVAVTPASGYVYIWGGLAIGAIAGVVCYAAVLLKPTARYDDSLDVFGVHGVGGFLGAVLTGVFCYLKVNEAAGYQDGLIAGGTQFLPQIKAAAVSAGVSFVGGLVLTFLVNALFGFTTTAEAETEGLDRSEHGEAGFDFGLAMESVSAGAAEPRPALVPPDGKRFQVVVDGVKDPGELIHTWSELCQPGTPPAEFKAVYPYVTTVQGNRFTFRGGDQEAMRDNIQRLFQARLKTPVKARVEAN